MFGEVGNKSAIEIVFKQLEKKERHSRTVTDKKLCAKFFFELLNFDGKIGLSIKTLHLEDLFNALADANSGATVVSFTNPDGSPQKVEKVAPPEDNAVAVRTYA